MSFNPENIPLTAAYKSWAYTPSSGVLGGL